MATNSKFSADLGLKTDADLQVDGNVTVSGNLTVNGTSTTVNSTTTSVEDSMLELANQNTSSDILDIGIYGNYDDGLGDGTSEYTGLFRDASDSTWKLFDGLEVEPTTTVNTSGSGYSLADIQVGDLTATTLTATNSLTGSSITYPTSDGTNGQVLTTNGSGTLSFSTISGYTDSDVETYLDGGTSTPTFNTITANNNGQNATTIAEFQYNDGATVLGRIGNQGNDSLFVQGGTSAGAGLVFHGSTGKILPARNGDSISEAIDLGQDTRRFKDIYMSGNISMVGGSSGGTITVDPSSGDAVLLLQGAAGAQTLRVDQNSIRTTTSNAFSVFTDGNTRQLYLNSNGHVGINQGSETPLSALDIIGSGYEQIRIGSNKTDNTNKTAGIVTTMYTNNSCSLFQGFFQNGSNALYYGSADGAHRGLQKHYFYVNDNYNATTGHTLAMQVSSGSTTALVVNGNNSTGGTVNWTSTKGSNESHAHYGTYGDWYIRPASNSGNVYVKNYQAESDQRLKENIEDITYGTAEILQLQPRKFNWIGESVEQNGFVAQEVESVLPAFVKTSEMKINEDDAEGIKSVDYNSIVATLVKTIQELEARIATLESS